jgi:hypothetical protein
LKGAARALRPGGLLAVTLRASDHHDTVVILTRRRTAHEKPDQGWLTSLVSGRYVVNGHARVPTAAAGTENRAAFGSMMPIDACSRNDR